MPEVVVLDANFLFSARLRDLWLELATQGVTKLRFSDQIDREWTEALTRARPELSEAISRTASLMKVAFARDYIPDDELNAFPALGLPDTADEHVARAALASGAMIVTLNLAHFPTGVLDQHGLIAMSPDAALLRLAGDEPDRVLRAVCDIRSRLKSPPLSASEYAGGFEPAGCPDFAEWMRRRLDQVWPQAIRTGIAGSLRRSRSFGSCDGAMFPSRLGSAARTRRAAEAAGPGACSTSGGCPRKRSGRRTDTAPPCPA